MNLKIMPRLLRVLVIWHARTNVSINVREFGGCVHVCVYIFTRLFVALFWDLSEQSPIFIDIFDESSEECVSNIRPNTVWGPTQVSSLQHMAWRTSSKLVHNFWQVRRAFLTFHYPQ